MILQQTAYFLGLGLGVFVPGWLLSRALRTTSCVLGSFLGSAAIIVNTIIAIDSFGADLDRKNVFSALAAVSLFLWLVARARSVPGGTESGPIISHHVAPVENANGRLARRIWIIAPLLGFLGITMKAILDPLSGYDTVFRWDFLARQMWREETLAYYPTATASDFLLYGWPDGIPPAVSCLYFLAYLNFGSLEKIATVPMVLVQAALLFKSAHELAQRWAGPPAGAAAAALLSSSSLFLWSVCIGQETGMTALCVVAMLLFIERWRTEPGLPWCAWAGLAAGLGALSREYGLTFVAIGGIALFCQRASWRHLIQFCGAFMVIAAPWYLRNFLHTGNFLWPHSLGGLLPGNPVHAGYMSTVASLWGPGSSAWPPLSALAVAASLGFFPLLFGIRGIFRVPFGRSFPAALSIVLVTLLWLWSLSSTSAGHLYALRVLSPAMVIGAVFGGCALTGRLSSLFVWCFAVLTAVATIDAAARIHFLPTKPAIAWWQSPKAVWLQGRDASARWNNDPNWDVLAQAAGGDLVLAGEPYTHAALSKRGTKVVPLFSPQVDFLFGADLEMSAGLKRLRTEGFRFILLSPDNVINSIQLPRHPFFHALRAAEPTVRIPTANVYDLLAFTSSANTVAAPAPP